MNNEKIIQSENVGCHIYREQSVEGSVIKRMIEEKGSYGYEDIVRYTAEEICRRKGIAITEDFFQGFLEASKFDNERRKQ